MNTTPTPTTETAISMASSVASLSAISSGPQEPSATPTQRLMESGGDATDVSFTSTPATPSGTPTPLSSGTLSSIPSPSSTPATPSPSSGTSTPSSTPSAPSSSGIPVSSSPSTPSAAPSAAEDAASAPTLTTSSVPSSVAFSQATPASTSASVSTSSSVSSDTTPSPSTATPSVSPTSTSLSVATSTETPTPSVNPSSTLVPSSAPSITTSAVETLSAAPVTSSQTTIGPASSRVLVPTSVRPGNNDEDQTTVASQTSIPSQTVQVPTSETTGPARTLTINGPIAGLTSTPAANTLPAPGETGVSQPGASDALNASASASKTRKNIAIVAALTGTLGVILIVVLCFFLYRRRQRKGNGAMWQPHVDHRHMSQRPMSAGSDSWVRFQGGSPTGSMIATSEESAVWQSYGPGGSNNLNNIGFYSAGTEVTTPYTGFMMQDNYTTVSLLANASTASIAPSTAIGRSESQMSSNSPSTWSSAQDDRTHLAAATFLATAPRPLPTALDNRSQQVVSPPMYTGVSTIAEESESALQRSFSPSSQLIAKAVPPTIQVESPGASQEGPSETPPLRGGFELFRRSFQSTLTQASELSELSAYSVSSPAYPGFSRPPLPPLPTNINTTANDGSVSAKPGPKLLIPQPVTSPHRESIVPSPGDNIDMFLDLASPTPEMLRNVGLDESPITANPFRDSTDTTSDYSHSASTPAGRFRWTEKEPLPKY